MGILDHAIAGVLLVVQSDPVLGIPITLLMVLCGFCWGLRWAQRQALPADGDGNLPAYFDFDLWFLR